MKFKLKEERNEDREEEGKREAKVIFKKIG